MSIIGVVIGICIVGIGIWTAQNYKTSVSTVVDIEENSPSSPSPTETPIPLTEPNNSPTIIMNNTPTTAPTKTPVPTTATQTTNISLSGFHYPGATVASSSGNRLELTTNDSPKTVTDWYKNAINQTGMNTKSFVTTSTNGNVINKLVAAGKGKEIDIDITKDDFETSVKIIVELK